MKTALRLLLALILLVVVVGGVCYLIGTRLPVDHSASVTGTVDAPPAKVYALITDVRNAPAWRKAVKSVQVLPPVDGADHWIEDLGHGTTMDFIATSSEPPTPGGVAMRTVKLADPGASYGGTWTYHILPGQTATQTTLKITEDGFINPPMYRFVMVHVFGMTHNLDQYLKDIQAAAKA